MEAETPAGAVPTGWPRIAAAAADALRTPAMEARGFRASGADMPALAAAAVAAPVAVALATRLVVGGLVMGPEAGLLIAAVGMAFTGLLATTTVALLWLLESAAESVGNLPEGSLHRAWTYALAVLCTFALPFRWMNDMGTVLLVCAMLAASYRRFSGLSGPPSAKAVFRDLAAPFAGVLSYQISLLALIQSGAYGGLGALIKSVTD